MRKLLNAEFQVHNHEHKTVIKIDNLTFGYSRKSKELNKLSFEIHGGEWTTILGPNGSGKSTLAKAIVRINKFREGSISLYSNDIKNFHNKEYAQNIAYIPQIMDVPEGISVYDFVSFGRNPWLNFASKMTARDHEIVKAALEQTNTYEMKDKMMENLSGGQRQRVFVALAIAQDTNIIILDEPTTYLDIRAQYELLELMSSLHNKGKTIITILHDINQAVQYSDEIVILQNGALYSKGTPEEVVTEKMLKEVYGVQTKLFVDEQKRKYITDVKLVEIKK